MRRLPVARCANGRGARDGAGKVAERSDRKPDATRTRLPGELEDEDDFELAEGDRSGSVHAADDAGTPPSAWEGPGKEPHSGGSRCVGGCILLPEMGMLAVSITEACQPQAACTGQAACSGSEGGGLGQLRRQS